VAAQPDRVLARRGDSVAGLLFGLLVAVLIGVVLTLFLLLRGLDQAGLTELHPTAGDEDLRIAGSSDAEAVPGLLVLRYDAQFYTANIRSLHRKILATVDALPTPPEVLVLDYSAIQALTVTVIDEEPQLERELTSRDHVLARRAQSAHARHGPAAPPLAGVGRIRPRLPHRPRRRPGLPPTAAVLTRLRWLHVSPVSGRLVLVNPGTGAAPVAVGSLPGA
jgi:STAS domain